MCMHIYESGYEQERKDGRSILRMRVRMLAIRLTVFAFTLVLSYVAPKAGSAWVRPHPTVEKWER